MENYYKTDAVLPATGRKEWFMKHITKNEWDAIPSDYKSTWMAYNDEHIEWRGRKTAFLPGYGTTLFIESISFEII